MKEMESLTNRRAPAAMSSETFKKLGHALVDQIAAFYDSLPARAVTTGEPPREIRTHLPDTGLPEHGMGADALLAETTKVLFDHSLHIGHPRFFGYITSPSMPVGVLGDFLAAAVNPNLGGWALSPVGSEIERQTIRWIAELVGYPPDCGGLMVSGGNVANLLGFFAARKARAPWDIRGSGLRGDARQLTVYASEETHTWIEKASDLAGLGTDAVRLIHIDEHQRMDPDALERRIVKDESENRLPFLAVATAGTVSTGAIDPLPEIAAICKKHGLWFHVDGAYGAPAAALPDAPEAMKGLAEADSVAIDPHKWLYSPLEAGCTLVRNPEHLHDAFSFRPKYYHFEEEAEDPRINFYEYGIQNSRGFRALKVWLGLRQVGREGYARMMQDDILLAKHLFDLADKDPELQAFTQGLSITTFRFVPEGLKPGTQAVESYLNELNERLLTQLQSGGETFLSNAVLDERFLLRACIVNFRTSLIDVEALADIVVDRGRRLDAELRPPGLSS